MKLYGHSIKKQHDAFSCSIFSIQDSESMSAIGVESLDQSLPLELDERAPQELNLARLHPCFLKSSQSQHIILKSLINKENAEVSVSSKKQKSFKDYVKKYLIAIEVLDKESGKNIIKHQNRAIDYKGFKYLTKALQTLEDIYQQGGNELLEQRMDARLLGLLSDCSKFANTDAGIPGVVTDETSLTAAVGNLSLESGIERSQPRW